MQHSTSSSVADARAAALRFMRFIVSGGLATGVMFVGSFLLLHAGLRPLAANLVAYAAAFVTGYTLQRGWTFEGRHAHGRALPRYFILQAVTAVLTAGVGEAGAVVLHLTPLGVSLSSALFSGVICFFGTNFWVFPDREANASVSRAQPRP